MFGTFLESVSENVSKEWTNRIFSPALVFWSITVTLLLIYNGWNKEKFDGFFSGLTLGDTLFYIVYGLLLIVISSSFIESSQLSIFRYLEGYWPKPFKILSQYLIRICKKKLDKKRYNFEKLEEKKEEWEKTKPRWIELCQKRSSCILNNEEEDEYKHILSLMFKPEEYKRAVILDKELDAYPQNSDHLLPTSIGNLLRATEEYPIIRYGLEPFIVWPRLWLVLSEDIKKEHNLALAEVNKYTQFFVWALISFFVWSSLILLYFLKLTSIMVAFFSFLLVLFLISIPLIIIYNNLYHATSVYCEVFCSIFDLYRFDLYRKLHLKAPTSLDDEDLKGESLSRYLKRGILKECYHEV